MGKCQLSGDQKALLRTLAADLQARPDPDRPWWVRLAHDAAEPQWQNVDDDALRDRLDAQTALADIIAFQECGFIANTGSGRYELDQTRLIEAVERDFFESG